jgi:uncharacterized protein YjiS (DUF1127 family)
MDASTYRELSLGDLTYINSAYDDDAAPAVSQHDRQHGVLHWVHDLMHRMAERQHRRAVMQELAIMSDRELSDIGLSRADILRIFDPDFRSNACSRDYIAY